MLTMMTPNVNIQSYKTGDASTTSITPSNFARNRAIRCRRSSFVCQHQSSGRQKWSQAKRCKTGILMGIVHGYPLCIKSSLLAFNWYTNPTAVIVGNESDLRSDQRHVPTDDGRKLAEEFNCSFTEASSTPTRMNTWSKKPKKPSSTFSFLSLAGELRSQRLPSIAKPGSRWLLPTITRL